MLFFKKKYINLILFILLLTISIFVLIFSKEISNIESLKNKDENKKEDENSKNCNKQTKIWQSNNKHPMVQTINTVQNTTHKAVTQNKCLNQPLDTTLSSLATAQTNNSINNN